MNKLFIAGIFFASMLVLAFVMPSVAQAQYYTGLCTPHSYESCYGNNIYWYDSCGNAQEISQYCTNGCSGNTCGSNTNYYYGYCNSHSYERCVGNNLYWYDSCGNQQELDRYCSSGCSGNTCQNDYNNYNYNNYNNYGNCTYHAYKLCSGNNVYWYNSCGNQQEIYTSCSGGQTCQYGQCTSYIQPIQPIQPIQNPTNYTAYNRTVCSGNSILWYDSLGFVSGTYKKCADNNSCTTDTCSGNACLNTLKCDGSTCATGSADYNTYCQPTQPIINPAPTPINPNVQNQPNVPNTNTVPLAPITTNTTPVVTNAVVSSNTNGLSASFFIKQNSDSNQWQKTAEINSDSLVYFMISATNASNAQIDNVNVSANIPNEISSLGNLKLNGVPITGDIVSGINIGSVAPTNTKLITFEGKTQSISAVATKQAVATVNASGAIQTDPVSINLNPKTGQNQAVAAAVSKAPVATGFMAFIKKWYIWILVGLGLILIFIVVYKRLSSNV